MPEVISASRRTDLIAFFPGWLSDVIKAGSVRVLGPSGHSYEVDLDPENVHTIVLWSKDFSNLIADRHGTRAALERYDQLYLLFTITGLGGTFIEQGVPFPAPAVDQLDPLIEIVGTPERVSVRFDPIIFWRDDQGLNTNLHFFEALAPELSRRGIKAVRFSFTQWYNKALKRAEKYDFNFYDPPEEEKLTYTRNLAEIAQDKGLQLYACSQRFLTKVEGIEPSSCIDGHLLQSLHPSKLPASVKKDKSQRRHCGCTESVDIGSYTQHCPHCCLYCYANPKL
jgi:hypothetical protein